MFAQWVLRRIAEYNQERPIDIIEEIESAALDMGLLQYDMKTDTLREVE
jgi:hypothetical protein